MSKYENIPVELPVDLRERIAKNNYLFGFTIFTLCALMYLIYFVNPPMTISQALFNLFVAVAIIVFFFIARDKTDPEKKTFFDSFVRAIKGTSSEREIIEILQKTYDVKSIQYSVDKTGGINVSYNGVNVGYIWFNSHVVRFFPARNDVTWDSFTKPVVSDSGHISGQDTLF